MAKMARIVIPNIPHHVTQRSNRRQRTYILLWRWLSLLYWTRCPFFSRIRDWDLGLLFDAESCSFSDDAIYRRWFE